MARPEWDIEAALKGLITQAENIKHADEGEGRRFTIAKPVPSELELYPERRVVRYRTPTFEAWLVNVESLYVAPNMVAMVALGTEELTTVTVQVDPSGGLRLETVIMSRQLPAVESAPATSHPQDKGQVYAGAAPPPAERRDPERRKQERTEYRGRLGFAPQLTTNSDSVDFITLSVAVKPADAPRSARPEWRNTTFYRERAHRVAEMHLQKGEMVDVVAYRDVREVATKGGKVRQETVYNGVMVRRA